MAERLSIQEYRRRVKERTKPNKFGAIRAYRCADCGGALAPDQARCDSCGSKAKALMFDSRAEARRWDQLRVMERMGVISDLERQVRIDLHAAGGGRVGAIVIDFSYIDAVGRKVHEDVKGGDGVTETKLFDWKSKHLRAEHGIEISIHKGG